MASSSSSSSSEPTTRSRTLLYISYRDSRASSSRFRRRPRYTANYEDETPTLEGDEQDRLIDSDAAHVAIDADLPPKWVDVAEQVEEILAGIQTKISSLDKLHAKHVLPGFSDRTAEEREIEAATSDVTKDFRRCHQLIQRITVSPQHSFPPSGGTSRNEELTAKNVQRGLAAKIQELSAAFRKKQRVYMEKLQGRAVKTQDLLVASGTLSLKGSDGLSALDEDIEAARVSRSQALAHETMMPDQDLRSRDRELTEIAKSIAQLAELFKDLSVMVIDQGTLLDSVEYNIEQTAVQMSDAVKELNMATQYQKNTGRRKCIFLLLLIIFGLILVLIFKPRRHHTPSASPLPLSSDSSSSTTSSPAISATSVAITRHVFHRRPSG